MTTRTILCPDVLEVLSDGRHTFKWKQLLSKKRGSEISWTEGPVNQAHTPGVSSCWLLKIGTIPKVLISYLCVLTIPRLTPQPQLERQKKSDRKLLWCFCRHRRKTHTQRTWLPLVSFNLLWEILVFRAWESRALGAIQLMRCDAANFSTNPLILASDLLAHSPDLFKYVAHGLLILCARFGHARSAKTCGNGLI